MIGNTSTRPRRWAAIFLALALITLIAGFGTGWFLAGQRGQERDDAEAATRPLTDRLLELCEQDTDRAERLTTIGLCDRAEDAREIVDDGVDPVLVPGPMGPPGPQGPVGPAGRDGFGIDGSDGSDGRDGENGRDGADGDDGADGSDGADGAQGEDGADGADGATGATGPKGETGPAGPQGPAGARGETGPQGPAGTARPGTYTCPDGDYVAGFTIAADGSVSLDCRTLTRVTGPPSS